MTDVNIIAAEIATLFKKPLDLPYRKMIASSIIGYRATILKQEYDKNGRYPLGSEDSFCLPLISVNPTDCGCSEDFECEIRRTCDKVPSPVRGNTKPEPFLYVGSANMSEAYIYGSSPQIVEDYLTCSKFLRDEKYYTYVNDYLYVFNSPSNKIGIRDVFSNPFDLLALKNCNGQPCSQVVLIEDDMRRAIKQMIIEDQRQAGLPIEDESVKINEVDQ